MYIEPVCQGDTVTGLNLFHFMLAVAVECCPLNALVTFHLTFVTPIPFYVMTTLVGIWEAENQGAELNSYTRSVSVSTEFS